MVKKTVKIFVGLTIIDFIVALFLGLTLPQITLFLVITHGLGALWATYVYTGKFLNGG